MMHVFQADIWFCNKTILNLSYIFSKILMRNTWLGTRLTNIP